MIEYDYKIIRIIDGEGTKEKFKPGDIPTQLPNIVYIEGPNSSGKSTLLNILALGLHGLKNPAIPDSLKKKMNSLLDVEHQQIEFKFSIENKDGEIELSSEKSSNNNEFKLYRHDNGSKRLLAPGSFEKYYNLVYNIPENPTDRLNGLTDEIEKFQILCSNSIGYVRQLVNEYLQEILKKDSEKIALYNEKYSKTMEELKKINSELPQLQDFLEKFERTVYTEYYYYYKGLFAKIQLEINKNEETTKRKKRETKRNTSKFEDLVDSLQDQVEDLDSKLKELCNCIRRINKNLPNAHKQLKKTLDICSTFSLLDTLEYFEFPTNYPHVLKEFSEIIENLRESIDEDLLKEARFLEELLNVLKNNRDLEILLPGERSIEDFLGELSITYDGKREMVLLSQDLEKAKDTLRDILNETRRIELIDLKNLKELKKSVSNSFDEHQKFLAHLHEGEKVKDLDERFEQYLEKKDEYEVLWISVGKPTTNSIQKLGEGEFEGFRIEGEEFIRDRIESLKNDIANMTTKKISLKLQAEGLLKEIKRLEHLEDHPFQTYADELQKLLKMCNNLEGKFRKDFPDYLKQLKTKKCNAKISQEQETYNSTVFEYLGTQMGKIFHIDKEYSVVSVDLLSEEIRTKDGVIIRFIDMGTGQSQSAYLTSLLKPDNNRKQIALFDEVAMMDKRSLSKIYSKIKRLFHNGHLLCAIVVQKADENVNIIDLRDSK